MILLNGRNIRLLDWLDTEVEEGDSIDIFPPAGGG
jgi:molybdopterin converting factor small subunit